MCVWDFFPFIFSRYIANVSDVLEQSYGFVCVCVCVCVEGGDSYFRSLLFIRSQHLVRVFFKFRR